MLSAVVIAFTYSWSLTLVTSSVLVFIGLVYGTVVPIVIKMQREMEHADAKASSIAGEVLGSIRMIVAVCTFQISSCSQQWASKRCLASHILP